MTLPFIQKPAKLFLLGSLYTALSLNYAQASETDVQLLQQPASPQLGKAPAIPQQGDSSALANRTVRAVPSNNTGGWSINPDNRQLARAFYNSVYLASQNTPINWTGTQASCIPGDTSSSFKNSVLARINYYRAMVGVPAGITLNSTYNTKAQQSALIMSANNSLSHFPPTTWNCYTADGAEAAGKSNISWGHNGWDAVDGQMRDNGSNNTEALHRAWLIHPPTQQMGTGDVADSGSLRSANSIWVNDEAHFFDPIPTLREGFTAWPTEGYNPYQIVPIRWSLGYPNADFSAASVSVSNNGGNLSVSIDNRLSGNPLASIVWRVNNMDANESGARWTQPSSDNSYLVTVSNVMVNGSPQTFSYNVIIMDPASAGSGEEKPVVSGTTSPAAGTSNPYTFNSVSFANDYNVLSAELSSSTTTYDAEDGGASVTDGTDSSYSLIHSGSGSNGTNVYKLAPATTSEQVVFNGSFLPSSSSVLTFNSILGYATNEQTAAVQISIDDGNSWADLYSITGTAANSPTQTSFQSHSIPLAAWANKIIKFRASFQPHRLPL